VWNPSRKAKSLRKAGLPDDVRIYAIGDIHGCTDLLRHQLAQIEADELRHPHARSTIIFLGDYIDRGPDSRGTIDLLLACARMREVICLKGNHETFIRQFLDAPESLNNWRSFGGLETLVSYGLRPSISRSDSDHERLSNELRAVMPAQHLAFLDSLPTSFICGDFFFVHAGVRPGLALARQSEDDLLWIRNEFLEHDSPFEKFIVHGHTPVAAPEVRCNRVNVDTGAFATGRLSCVAIEGTDIVPLLDIREWTPGTVTRMAGPSSRNRSARTIPRLGSVNPV
jgi:serine/threonine protein phosphatase 1